MHVLLTGASSGIGAALARHMAAAGMDLTLVARRADRLQDLAAEIAAAGAGAGGGRVHVLPRDLCDPAAVDTLPAEAEAALGPVDVLVNNAGMELVARTHEADPAQAARLLELNLAVPLRLSRLVLPGMLARRCGTLVSIASVAAFGPLPYATHYCAAKAGLAAADRQMRWELRGSGVHVLTVYPGPIPTDMGQAAFDAYQGDWTTRLLPWGSVDGLARRVLSAIDQGRGEVVYPSLYRLVRWAPWTADLIFSFVRVELSDAPRKER